EVRPEIRMTGTILLLGSEANAVEQLSFQGVVLRATEVRPLVHDDARHLLPDASAKHAGLPRLDREALFQRDRADMVWEPENRMRKGLAAREHEIVGVASVR